MLTATCSAWWVCKYDVVTCVAFSIDVFSQPDPMFMLNTFITMLASFTAILLALWWHAHF